jgi:phosphoenolpyruvate synthase/pyruvate phosphate dikinase
MAVQVQPFVPAEVSATVRAGGGQDTVLIQARWGLPEDSPAPGGRDLVTIRRSDLALASRRIVTKNRMWAAGEGGAAEVDVPAPLRFSACLSDDQARQIAGLGLEFESRLGSPVEAEVMLAAGHVYLAWCHRQGAGDQRPIDARPARDPEPS